MYEKLQGAQRYVDDLLPLSLTPFIQQRLFSSRQEDYICNEIVLKESKNDLPLRSSYYSPFTFLRTRADISSRVFPRVISLRDKSRYAAAHSR